MPPSILLLMSPEDNCLIARLELKAGTAVVVDGRGMTLAQDIPIGHKVARRAIKAGDKVRRYGAAIGTATADIAMGEHIHSHNLRSDHVPTHALFAHGRHLVLDRSE
jgi:hypothetical protein